MVTRPRKPSSQNRSQPIQKSPPLPRKHFFNSLPGSNQNLFLSSLVAAREVTTSEAVYQYITKYVKNGQVHKYKVKVNKIIEIVRNLDLPFEQDGLLSKRFRMMLWHGTKLAKIAPILQNGFLLPPPNGQMFGPGIYFADRISKSCNYSDGTSPGSKAYLFLCDVLVGLAYNAKNAHNDLTEAPSGFRKKFDSVMCTGEYVPDRSENVMLNGSIIPCGKTIKNTKFPSYNVQYNEYIVYDGSKINFKYLVEVEFS